MNIEILYTSDCPNFPQTVETITKVLEECGLKEQITPIEVTDQELAVRLAFPGSPTVRINGSDVEPELPPTYSYGLTCRTYMVNGKRQGAPHYDWIHDAICRVASCQGRR